MKYIKENNMHCDLYRKLHNYCFLNKALTVTTNMYFKGFFLYKFENQRDRDRNRQIFYALIHSPYN